MHSVAFDNSSDYSVNRRASRDYDRSRYYPTSNSRDYTVSRDYYTVRDYSTSRYYAAKVEYITLQGISSFNLWDFNLTTSLLPFESFSSIFNFVFKTNTIGFIFWCGTSIVLINSFFTNLKFGLQLAAYSTVVLTADCLQQSIFDSSLTVKFSSLGIKLS